MKEKASVKENNKKYGTERGSHRIIIKRISDVVIRMAKKTMACKLIRKCHKEEVPTGAFIVEAQCA
jgi:hypothetical protein